MSRWIVIFPNNNCLSGIGHSHKETEKEISIGKSASHTNLSTYNVPALAEFFCSVFGFQLIEKRADKLSVLRNAAPHHRSSTRRQPKLESTVPNRLRYMLKADPSADNFP